LDHSLPISRSPLAHEFWDPHCLKEKKKNRSKAGNKKEKAWEQRKKTLEIISSSERLYHSILINGNYYSQKL